MYRTFKTKYAVNHECETSRSIDTPTDRRRRGQRGGEGVRTPKRRIQRRRPPPPPPHERGNSMWQSYGPWRCRWRACLQAGSRRALSFLHPAPRNKKRKKGTEEKNGRRRGERPHHRLLQSRLKVINAQLGI